MPNPNEIKEIIDAGAYVFGTKALGTAICVAGTVPTMLAKHGIEPEGQVARRYVQAAKAAEEALDRYVEAGDALIADLVSRAT